MAARVAVEFKKERYEDVYPGVDAIYYGNQGQLEYDLVVAPGANPRAVQLAFQGAGLTIGTEGDLVLSIPGGEIRMRKPLIYQEVSGIRVPIPGGWVLLGLRQAGFEMAAYDRARPLVIDPVLSYSTYLGGSSFDQADAIAVDAVGNAYVTGGTGSTNFPVTAGAFQTTLAGSGDAFVTKLNPAGSGLVYSTYLGGVGVQDPAADGDGGLGLAVDTAGSAYITGQTNSSDFPTTPGAFQTTNGGGESDTFVTKLNATGSGLIYSTLLGGNRFDQGQGIVVDAAGNAYVTGPAQSTNFPTTPGAFRRTLRGSSDAFVAKLNPTGSGLVYSTYLGGGGNAFEYSSGVAVDAVGNAYVTGFTQSTNFPTTAGAFQTAAGGDGDAFVTKLNPIGSGLVYSTYLGGNLFEEGTGIALDGLPNPNAYVAGTTIPPGFPTTTGAFQTAPGGNHDAFVAKITDSVPPPPPTGPAARVWIGLANSDDVGIRFDLRAEVYRNGTQLVSSGEVASVQGGSSGFNNANLHAISLTPVPGVTLLPGDALSFQLYVRNACSGSGKNSGRARLWYNDATADSRFDATIGNQTYYLLNGFALGTAPGTGPKQTIDVAAGAKCSPYKLFGTWTGTVE
jgi:Beta-propeller repeat